MLVHIVTLVHSYTLSGKDPKISLLTAKTCLDAAIARWGSEQALLNEIASRKARSAEKHADKAAAAEEEKAAAAGPSEPGPAKAKAAYIPPEKETCNFPALNQAAGLLTSPAYGMVHLPTRRSAIGAAAAGAAGGGGGGAYGGGYAIDYGDDEEGWEGDCM